MPSRQSAGVLLFRRDTAGRLEVLLGHMGGPFWARKNAAAWTIPKGEPLDGEELWDAAQREFTEELGVPLPRATAVPLGAVRQSGGKVVTAWAIGADLDVSTVVPGTFEMEWPPRSGATASFPELDRVQWLPVADARELIVTAQRDFLDRLEASLS